MPVTLRSVAKTALTKEPNGQAAHRRETSHPREWGLYSFTIVPARVISPPAPKPTIVIIGISM